MGEVPSESLSLGWQDLSFVPSPLLSRMIDIYKSPHVVASAVDTEDDMGELVSKQVARDALVRQMWCWVRNSGAAFKRRRLSVISAMDCTLSPCDSVPKVSVDAVFEEIVHSSPRFALDAVKKIIKRMKKPESQTTRASREAAALDRWALELASIIQEAWLPVVYHVEGLSDPSSAWKRIFGNRRAKTLRNRYRAWSTFRLWLVAATGRSWPNGIHDLINYVEESVQVGCAKTLPGSFQAALVVLETVGRVPEADQLSKDGTWLAHLKSWETELSTVVQTRGPAKPYTISILVALEVLVVSSEELFYKRLVGWVMLLAVCACMRIDDIQCILPESLRLSSRGLSVRLGRTKATGPGKLHGQVWAFVDRGCSARLLA